MAYQSPKTSPVDTGTKRTVGMPTVVVSAGGKGWQQYDFSGSYDDFQAFYSVTSGSGLTRATPPAPRPAPAVPKVPTPPPEDQDPPGSGDPSDWPPFEDPNDPFIPAKPGGSAEVPGLPGDDLPEIVVHPPTDVPTVMGAGSFAFGPIAANPRPAPAQPPKRRPRRTPPPPKRTRPVRPTRPSPGRIPIPVPPLEEVKISARRSLPGLLLSFVPTYLGLLGRVDQYGTEHMFDRLFPPIPGRRDERKPRANPRPSSPQPDALGDIGAPGDVIDTVVVTGSRPNPVAPPDALSLMPFREPGYIYPPDVPAFTRPNPTRLPRRRPIINPQFDLPHQVGNPYVLPQPNPLRRAMPRPIANPEPAPAPSPSPAPQPSPRPRPQPSPSPSPIGAPSLHPVNNPLSSTGPLPLQQHCSCRVVDPNKKRKPRREHHELDHPPKLEAVYITKFGRVVIEGKAEKYCVKAPGRGARICYDSEQGFKPGSLMSKIFKRRK